MILSLEDKNIAPSSLSMLHFPIKKHMHKDNNIGNLAAIEIYAAICLLEMFGTLLSTFFYLPYCFPPLLVF